MYSHTYFICEAFELTCFDSDDQIYDTTRMVVRDRRGQSSRYEEALDVFVQNGLVTLDKWDGVTMWGLQCLVHAEATWIAFIDTGNPEKTNNTNNVLLYIHMNQSTILQHLSSETLH